MHLPRFLIFRHCCSVGLWSCQRSLLGKGSSATVIINVNKKWANQSYRISSSLPPCQCRMRKQKTTNFQQLSSYFICLILAAECFVASSYSIYLILATERGYCQDSKLSVVYHPNELIVSHLWVSHLFSTV